MQESSNISSRHDAHWELLSGLGFHFLVDMQWASHWSGPQKQAHNFPYKGFISKSSSHCRATNMCVLTNEQKVSTLSVRDPHVLAFTKLLLGLWRLFRGRTPQKLSQMFSYIFFCVCINAWFVLFCTHNLYCIFVCAETGSLLVSFHEVSQVYSLFKYFSGSFEGFTKVKGQRVLYAVQTAKQKILVKNL